VWQGEVLLREGQGVRSGGVLPGSVRSGCPEARGLLPGSVRSRCPEARGLLPGSVRSRCPEARGLLSGSVRSRCPEARGLLSGSGLLREGGLWPGLLPHEALPPAEVQSVL